MSTFQIHCFQRKKIFILEYARGMMLFCLQCHVISVTVWLIDPSELQLTLVNQHIRQIYASLIHGLKFCGPFYCYSKVSIDHSDMFSC